MTRIEAEWLNDPGVGRVFDMLERAGHQAFFVGGCVRNALLGREVADLDIATDARPEIVQEQAAAAQLRAVPTGLEHGTVTVISEGRPYEVTTFRRDVATDGRRAVVAFATDMEEDAHRRDFTMNALYADRRGEVLDLVGGLEDLRRRHLRFVGDAATRIREDYLRILRFFRFHAWYGDPEEGLDPEALAACISEAEGLAVISRERIGSEIVRLLQAPDPAPAVAVMRQGGILARVLPGANDDALPVLVHLEQSAGQPPCHIRRLALLGGEDPAGQLRLSRAEARALRERAEAIAEGGSAARLGYVYGPDAARDALLIRSALFKQPVDPEMERDLARGAAACFPVKAADLMPALTGPALGQRLAELEKRWIASDFSATREELLS